jgi:hypothetical protein
MQENSAKDAYYELPTFIHIIRQLKKEAEGKSKEGDAHEQNKKNHLETGARTI